MPEWTINLAFKRRRKFYDNDYTYPPEIVTDSAYTAEERKWLEEQCHSEYKFLKTYNLDINKEDDRATGRTLARKMRYAHTDNGLAHWSESPIRRQIISEQNGIPTWYDANSTPRTSYKPYIVKSWSEENLLTAHLDSTISAEDANFSIQIGEGTAVLVSQKLWEKIPHGERPKLSLEHAKPYTDFTKGESGEQIETLGGFIMPVVLFDHLSKKQFRIKLWARLVRDLSTDMFIGYEAENGSFQVQGYHPGLESESPPRCLQLLFYGYRLVEL